MTVNTFITIAFMALALPSTVMAQGFAGLGRAADGFSLPQRDYEFDFPRDHGAHPGEVRTGGLVYAWCNSAGLFRIASGQA